MAKYWVHVDRNTYKMGEEELRTFLDTFLADTGTGDSFKIERANG